MEAAPLPPHVTCKGLPYEIGHEHGRAASKQVHGSIAFYTAFFQETARLQWDAVTTEAQRWLPYLEAEWADYVDEMRGIAEGSGVPFTDILALNVRTEIAYGLAAPGSSSDGCTALAYHPTGQKPFLAQNWDWEARQSPNLIRLTIHQAAPKAALVDMITEGGIIGKIGLSSAGVGVCLNAIRAPKVSHNRLPVHMALRAVMDADSSRILGTRAHINGHINGGALNSSTLSHQNGSLAEQIAAMLQRVGVASAAHILVADAHKAIGVETSFDDTAVVPPISTERSTFVPHTNHFVCSHGVTDKDRALKDSPPRLARIEELVQQSEAQGVVVNQEVVTGWLSDEEGYPSSICRDRAGKADLMTLFSIVMDLQEKRAKVGMGRKATEKSVLVLDVSNP